MNLEWIQWAESEPTDPEGTHRCEDNREDEFVLRIDLPGLFQEFIPRSKKQTNEKGNDQDEIATFHCLGPSQ
jgi:hypothetical protein